MRQARRSLAATTGVVALAVLALAKVAVAGAGEPGETASGGRGWVFGGSLGFGREGYPGADGLALAIGPVVSREVVDYGTPMTIETRAAAVVPAGVAPDGAIAVVPFPGSEAQISFSFHGGYAFSRRFAMLIDVQMGAGFSETSFDQIVGGGVLRYSPVPRLWVQAGPGTGQLRGHYDGAKTPDMESRVGLLAGAGVVLLRRNTWALDLQVRYARLPHDGFTTSRLHFAVGAGRRRS
jgi:hypothetical protein